MTMSFRKALPDDAANVAALTTQVWLHTYARRGIRQALSDYVLTQFTAENFRPHLAADTQYFILCEIDGHLVGYLRLDFDAPCPELSDVTTQVVTLYVQEHFIGKGIGAELLREADLLSARRSATHIWLAVNHQNAHAIQFYERQGFERRGSTYFEFEGERHENFIYLRIVAQPKG
ncbi:GNAT family N-acetyltransferase [Rhizobium sullae]|uniref:GNAT family N-acetyltransferase n=1 Tax=Rhizobium sullae TaxID=50338 RepID=UPI000B35DE6B|nr:GNAT family N-acetyltransferase [Rhizobium sullae]